MNERTTSPCMRCTKVSDPCACEDKTCAKWRRWYIARWDAMRLQPRLMMEQPLQPQGICIGGTCYAQPHRVRSYLQTDPCDSCLCPRDVCTLPCRAKRSWLHTRQTIYNA